MSALTGAYSNFRPRDNPEQAEVYIAAIQRMAADVGQGRTAAAIAVAIDLVPDFCPTVAKIREFIPSPDVKVKTCTDCHPGGFVQVFSGRTDGGNQIDPKIGAVKRCNHEFGKSPVLDVIPDGGHAYGKHDIEALWQIHKKKRAQLGRPLTEQELNGCLSELDRRITALPRESVKS